MKITKWQIWKAKRTLKKFLKKLKQKNNKFLKFASKTNQLLFKRLMFYYGINFLDFEVDLKSIKFIEIDERFYWFKVKINQNEIKLPVIRERYPFDVSGMGEYGVVFWSKFNLFFE